MQAFSPFSLISSWSISQSSIFQNRQSRWMWLLKFVNQHNCHSLIQMLLEMQYNCQTSSILSESLLWQLHWLIWSKQSHLKFAARVLISSILSLMKQLGRALLLAKLGCNSRLRLYQVRMWVDIPSKCKQHCKLLRLNCKHNILLMSKSLISLHKKWHQLRLKSVTQLLWISILVTYWHSILMQLLIRFYLWQWDTKSQEVSPAI